MHFHKNVLIPFTSVPTEFFPIHSGTATLSVTFTPPGASSQTRVDVPVMVNSAMPFTLGQAPNQLDTLIEGFADLRGIPPQILKAQIQRESTFNPNSYRYEPLTVDFASVSAGQNLRTAERFMANALATFPDSNPPPEGLPQGERLTPGDIEPRQVFFIELDKSTGLPLREVFAFDPFAPSRTIQAGDRFISMENIFYTNDDTSLHRRQNWGVSSPEAWIAFNRYRASGNLPFTAQTVLASSYGLMQLLYTTAVDELGYTDINLIGASAKGLFTALTSVDLGTEKLARASILLVPGASSLAAPSFADLGDLLYKFGLPLKSYNGGSVTESTLRAGCNLQTGPVSPNVNRRLFKRVLYPCAILVASRNFFPVR